MTQRKEHSWNEWDYENRRTPVWVMMLTSASCCRYLQQDPACSFSVRQDSDSSTQGTAPVYVIDMSEEQINGEDMIRRRHVLLRCADSSLNHEWSKTATFVSCLDACLDAVGVRPPLYAHFPGFQKPGAPLIGLQFLAGILVKILDRNITVLGMTPAYILWQQYN
jgi:hypothetical protein